MRINPQNFFNHYIIDPLSRELSILERMMALSLSILLAVPTLGILHIRAKYLQSKNIVNLTQVRNERQVALRNLANSISKVTFGVLQPGQEKIRCKPSDVGRIVQERFIQPFYAKPLPTEEQVTVPYEGKWVKWQDLTRSQKIEVNNTGTREHNQLPSYAPTAAVDRWFFAHGQAPFLPNDPRQSHGNDHAARASLFAAVFAYLYQKYDPDTSIGIEDMMLAQIVAAGHDSGRQTEGPDVYDAKSAENTVEILKSLGVTDQKVLQDAHEAIEHKDSDPLTTKKSLIARCVQNADSAEFARLLLSSGRQAPDSFESSKEFLDIYRELKTKELKDGRSFKNFVYELDALRKEMNDLIFQTHRQEFRSKVASANGNIYNEILQLVTPTEFPLLYKVLTHIGIKEPLPSAELMRQQHIVSDIRHWINYGVANISTESLEKLYKQANNCQIDEALEVGILLEGELKKRASVRERYEKAATLEELATAYAYIPKVERQIQDFQKRAEKFLDGVPLLDALARKIEGLPGTHLQEALVVLVDLEHEELLSLYKKGASFETLLERAQNLLASYKKASELFRSDEVQTTLSIVFSHLANGYLQNNENEKAKWILNIAATELQIEPSNKFYDLKGLLAKEKQGDAILYETRDSMALRRRKLGVQEKKVTGQQFYELSLEIPRGAREEFQKRLDALVDTSQKEVVPSKFYRKSGTEFVTQGAVDIGEDLKITIEDGVEIFIGNTKKWCNQYHLMRIRVADGVSSQKVHSALAKIGLPMALMPSRKEDILLELRAKSIGFRFPQIVHKDPSNPPPPDVLYESLTDAQKAVVDEDCRASFLTHVGNGHFEQVVPSIAEQAWKLGVRSVATFIWGGTTMEDTATVVKNIIKNGLLSSQERFKCGILGNGCCPFYNYQSGSANQVFTRILTQNLFEDGFKLDNFAIRGRVLVMLDTKVLERMPYSYTGDRNGVRNPDFYESYFHAQKQDPIFGFKGKEMIQQRLGFEEHVSELYRDPFPLNESMFDLNVGGNYIQKLVVQNGDDRIALIAALQKSGVYEIGGRPIEEVVAVADSLKPELVPSFYDPNPYMELQNGAAYI